MRVVFQVGVHRHVSFVHLVSIHHTKYNVWPQFELLCDETIALHAGLLLLDETGDFAAAGRTAGPAESRSLIALRTCSFGPLEFFGLLAALVKRDLLA